RLVLKEAIDLDSLERRPQEGICRSIGRDRCARYHINDGIPWACEMRLVDGDLAELIEAARTNVGHFKQQVLKQFVLNTSVVLIKVGRADIAIEKRPR